MLLLGTASGGGGLLVLPNYFYAFDSTDTRRDVTTTLYAVAATNVKSPRRLGEITDGKFRKDWRVPLLPGTALNPGYNWPLIRFADVLLMFAEAENELSGPTAAAVAAFEEVRKRARYKGSESKIGTTPTDKVGFFNAIVNERYLEFGSEGIRKFDLIRWNLLAQKIAEARQKNPRHQRCQRSLCQCSKIYFLEKQWGRNPMDEFFFLQNLRHSLRHQRVDALDWRQHLTTNLIDGVQLQCRDCPTVCDGQK